MLSPRASRYGRLGLSLFLATAAGLRAVELIDFRHPLPPGQLTTRGVAAAVVGGSLEITGASSPSDGAVILAVPAKDRDLSRFRFVEADLENLGNQPVPFTFWALSGHGWGGASTFTPEAGPTSGREALEPRGRRTFRIDLWARYPGKDVYTPATNPASVRWLELILGSSRVPASVRVWSMRAVGEAPAQRSDVQGRVLVPEITREQPAAGRRVYQQLPGWEKTSVTHVLTLPRDWKPGGRYPIIVEYTGNVFYHKFCHSTGYTDQGTMAYGLARGEEYICLNLPFISEDGQREQINGWGDIDRAIDYCLAAVRFVGERYGGDPGAVFFVGFSRGEIAANYLALRNDRIAALWLAFIGTNPGRPWRTEDGAGWNKAGLGWDERAARLGGRPWFSAPANLGSQVHVDVQYLEDRPGTVATRAWMRDLLARRADPAAVEPAPPPAAAKAPTPQP